MTHQRSHATVGRLKAIANNPATAPASMVWRERFTPKRYRKGGNDGTDGSIIPVTCPTRMPGGGGMPRELPEAILA